MSEETIENQIIEDLKKDFPKIKEFEKTEEGLIIKADEDTIWEVFEVLYNGMDNVELNLAPDEEPTITIKL